MKLLIFIHSLGGGGAERVTAHLANHWVTKGIQIAIVTLASRDEDRYALDPAIDRISLERANISRGPVDAIFANVRRVRALRRVLVDRKPDVALAMMSNSNVLLALATVGLPGVRAFGSERIHPPALPIGKAWGMLRSTCYRLLEGVVAQTTKSREWVVANTSAKSVAVIPNPVVWPVERSSPVVPPESVGVPGRKRILAVGRLDRQKGFDILLGAIARMGTQLPDWELVIVGEGRDRAALQSRIRSLNLTDRAYLVGNTGNIGDWYESADIFVCSSRFEGFPNALAEAMAYGVAVVSFDCDTGPRDLIADDTDGLLVPPEDAEKLGSAMLALMQDDERRARLAARAVDVRNRFAIDRISERWLDLFRANVT